MIFQLSNIREYSKVFLRIWLLNMGNKFLRKLNNLKITIIKMDVRNGSNLIKPCRMFIMNRNKLYLQKRLQELN